MLPFLETLGFRRHPASAVTPPAQVKMICPPAAIS